MMKKIRFTTCLLAAVLAAASFTGCGDSAAADAAGGNSAADANGGDSPVRQESERQAPINERGTMAKVVSLNGDQLTVILADMPVRGGGNGTPPAIGGGSDNGTPPAIGAGPGNDAAPPDQAAPQNGRSGPAAPASGAAVDGPGATAGNQAPAGDQARPGGSGREGGGEITFTGEEVTYTLADDLVIMKGTGNSAAEIDLSELAAGDVIRFTTTTGDDGNETIDSISMME